MLPIGVSNTLEVRAVAFAEHGALDVRGLELAARLQRAALVVDQRLRDVEAARGLLAVAERNPDPVLARGVADAVELGRADDQRVVVVALHELHAPGRRIEPDPPRDSRAPRFPGRRSAARPGRRPAPSGRWSCRWCRRGRGRRARPAPRRRAGGDGSCWTWRSPKGGRTRACGLARWHRGCLKRKFAAWKRLVRISRRS